MENKHIYNLNNFTPEEIKRAKEFVKMAVIGYYTVRLDAHIDELFNNMRYDFYPQDEFTLHFSIQTIGNDILAALGVARYEQTIK